MKPIVQLHRVHKWALAGGRQINILNGISMSVQRGEFIAVMGASGSGKSTLLNLIGLLESPDAGSIDLLGHPTRNLKEEEQARIRIHGIGFIFQSFNLLPYLTARQNVELPMLYSKRREASKRSLELLRRLHLAHRINAYPATLSGGEKQRVAIARALANDPQLVLADEPTGALDSQTGTQIMDQLKDLHRKGVAIILVTHDENVARYAERRIHMRDGRIV